MYPNSRFVFVLALVSLIAAGQESRPTPAVKLPVTDQARPSTEDGVIDVWVARTGGSETRTRSRGGDWRIHLRGEDYPVDDGTDQSVLKLVLARLAEEKMRATPPRVSERSLRISADAAAPYGHVQKVLEAAAAARIHKIEISTTRGAIETPLPIDAQEPVETETRTGEVRLKGVPEVRVLLAWNSAASKVERMFGTEQFVPPTADGDRKLETLIKAEREQLQKAGTPDVCLVIDSGPGVPWQSLVDVMTVARRAGVKRIEYGTGAPAPK